MLISVILPVYNVEEYIGECLDSLLNQSIGESQLEIILVNDCSTDNTEEIIKQYEQYFTNIKYYKLKENEGSPGKPRNIGVALSTGDYIHFMDPDDILDSFTYETLLEFIKDEDDFIMGKLISFNEDGSEFQHVTFREYKMNKTYISTTLEETPFFAQVKVGVVLKLIRKSFYISNEIYFEENMKNGEDKLVDTKLYTLAKSFSYIPYVIYRYRNRNIGENKSLTNQESLTGMKNDIKAYHSSKNYYSSNTLDFFRVNVLRSLFWKILDSEFEVLNYKDKIEIMKEINNIIKGYKPVVFSMYLKQEEPIINLINDQEYQLAISYSSLLHARRKYFYRGIELKNKYHEIVSFKKSKSYKIFRILNHFRILSK
ncbi:glycosyltransferase family 2 protein [Staphylococcus xylosus]|uniref:glycosyltransferase family 2 protein n=1 Tax=Staphylococcus xylosus TaxID=1288 RepID=UPI000852A324|nr:glycosyltransferase family 2 protein [Staphylococcus xylosus]MCA2501195.1 glycosyltransferase family 2 protein [Staphylococcus xylosus]MCA2501402.1 glycosyltransferase family 2 protein [Staphylococcus xylosus]MCE7780981.1 glycosyltransferase family 2 protein [Staphylococcus xylosus]OEK87048.1 glycosyl transferase [Staphylococcus xylosus]